MKIGIGFHQSDFGLGEEIKNVISEGNNVIIEFIQEERHSSVCKRILEGYDYSIVIFSEDFLKSVNCMDGCLDLINQKGQKLIPIIAPGTVLNKVTHIIRYINFWQDQYLELRKGKEETEEYQSYLSTVRTISTEVGEFIRMLRNLELIDFEEDKNSNFQQILTLLDFNLYPVPNQDETQTHITPPPVPNQDETQAHITPPPVPNQDETQAHIAPPPVPNQDETQAHITPPPVPNQDETQAHITPPPVPNQDETQAHITPPPVPNQDETQAHIAPPPVPNQDETQAHITPPPVPNQDETQILEESGALESDEIINHETNLIENEIETISQLIEDLAHDDENTGLLNKLAERYVQEGEYENAKVTLKKIKNLDPFYPNVHLQIAILEFHFLRQNVELALEHIEKAILQNEKDSEPYYQKGLILNELGAEEEKIRWQFEKAIELDPEHPFATYELALSFLKMGDIKQANKLYQQAITINPETKSDKNDKAFALPKEPVDSLIFNENIKRANKSEQGSNKKISDFISDLKDQIEQLQQLLNQSNTHQDSTNPNFEKVVLITGASSGIGKATAIRLAQERFGKIIITGRRENKLKELKQQIENQYPDSSVQISVFDISNYEEVETSITSILEKEQRIDVLINNAGKAKGLAPIHKGNLSHWEEMIDTNIKGLLYITRLISKRMIEQKNGHILNIGSTAGKEVYPSGNVYCATKFAVDALTKAFRLDLYEHNIRVSQVSPGHVEETEFAKVRFDGDEEKAKIYEDFIPLNARDIADSIAYILTRPPHVNVQDILLMGTQQAGAFSINRNGR